jgi:hypothetical protein
MNLMFARVATKGIVLLSCRDGGVSLYSARNASATTSRDVPRYSSKNF